MTNDEAIKELKEDIGLYIPLHGTIEDIDRELPDGRLITALEMGIEALELIGLLKGRPCEACIFSKGACSKWSCPFDKQIGR